MKLWGGKFHPEIPSPWVPVLNSEEDCSWFERYPDSKEPAKEIPKELEHLFDDF